MLSTLRIRNLALVTDLTVEFEAGLNVITGETGAGKSILIGALNLVLGERADRTLIRSGANQCTVEAVFEVSSLQSNIDALLEENGLDPCEEGQLLLKRVVAQSGTNRQFINGSPTTVQVLALVGDQLVDIHGPHDHQSLLHPARQLEILDAYGNLEKPRAAFAACLEERRALEHAKAELIIDDTTYAQQLDLLRFQTREIAEARLDPNEEPELAEHYQRQQNAAQLLQVGHAAAECLSGEDHSAIDQTAQLGRLLAELTRLDPAAEPLAQQQEQAINALQDLQGDLSRYLDQTEVDPERLQALEDRYNLIQSLKRKYGSTLQDIIAFGAEAERKLQSLEQREEELERLQAALETTDAALWKTGTELAKQRARVIPKLSKAVTAHLQELGFQQSHFDATLSTPKTGEADPAAFNRTGLDTIEFQFAPNPGEPARPLRAIASSGEMARVMLAVKTVLATADKVPVLMFDEVDANVGGETAHAVGEKMRQVAAKRQVFCVSHLAPVAAYAQSHYRVSKSTSDGRTVSVIDRLDDEERITELSRMLGGQSKAARQLAQSILKKT